MLAQQELNGNGATGAQGPIGPTGANGTNGLNGATGAQGPIGPTGANGTNGLNGATGAQGPIGPTGANGTNGLNGATGPQGPSGLDGATGAQGPIGPTGANGTNGLNGATGVQGPTGAQGPTGVDGATGPTGPTIRNALNTDGVVVGPTIANAYQVWGTDAAGNPAWVDGEFWKLRGNAGTNPAINFVGTTDARDLVFRTTNTERMRVLATGPVGVGYNAPTAQLDVASINGWDVVNTAGDFEIGGGNTYQLRMGVAQGGAGAGDAYILSRQGTQRIWMGGGTNNQLLQIYGTNNSVGVRVTGGSTPASALDVNGDLALREGPVITVGAGVNSLVLTGEYSHYRLMGATGAFSISSIFIGNNGQILTLINSTGQPMTITNTNSPNCILTGTNSNLVSNGGTPCSVTMIYNVSFGRWMVIASSGMMSSNDWHTVGNTAITNPAAPGTYGVSAIAATENWMGTTDARDIVFGTNNIERMRIMNTTGRVGLGTAAPGYLLHVVEPTAFAFATTSSNTYNGTADGTGLYAQALNNPGYGYAVQGTGGYVGASLTAQATNYTGFAYGIYAQATGNAAIGTRIGAYFQATGGATNYGLLVPGGGGNVGFGTTAPVAAYKLDVENTQSGILSRCTNSWALNAQAGGTFNYAINYTNGTVGSSGFTAPWGIYGGGIGHGVMGWGRDDLNATAGTDADGGFFGVLNNAQNGVIAVSSVAAYLNGTTYKIVGFGGVSTIVQDQEGQSRIMTAPETPEMLLEDLGDSKLENGRVHVTIDPILAKNIHVDAEHPLKVVLTPKGDCKGLYVTNEDRFGFDVVEMQGGTSNVRFTWFIAATRENEVHAGKLSNYVDHRFKKMTNPAFDFNQKLDPKDPIGPNHEIVDPKFPKAK
ncbi:MAG: hypothetical protein U0T73_06355 [Chitinophagales bacterium]